MIVGVQANLRAHLLILRDPEICSWILTSMALSGLKLVTIGERAQDLITKLPLRVNSSSIFNELKYKVSLNLLLSIGLLKYREEETLYFVEN